ncbi:aspartic peptidase domain-containing protein [Neurospora intermedia]|uniref:Aspartic peptidase domain-containing protein n=1 Tax=Neurospora intermedia TaxID=5142 RepID=A0ABR3DF07_NEUIN
MAFSIFISALVFLKAYFIAAVVLPGLLHSQHHHPRRDPTSAASFSLAAHYNAAFHSAHHDQPSNHGLASYYRSLSRLPNINLDSIPLGLKRVVSGKPKGSSSSLPAIPFWEEREYLTPLTVGTPPQTVVVNIDTGSISLWLLSSETFIANKTLWVLYDVGKSTTAEKVVNASWATHYEDGSYAAGNVYHDTLRLGNVELPKAVIQSALEVSLDLASDLAISGIMGLAYNMSSDVHPLGTETTVLEQIFERLDQPLMTIDLRTHANGTYTFGSIPASISATAGEKGRAPYKGEINYYPLSPSPYWQTTYASFSIANSTYQSPWMNAGGLKAADTERPTRLAPTSSTSPPTTTSTDSLPDPNVPATQPLLAREAIIDTGTSNIMLPDAIVKSYYAHVPGAVFRTEYNTWTFPCDLKVPVHTRSGPPPTSAGSSDEEKMKPEPVLPDLKIAFGREKGGWHATIPGALFNYSVIEVKEGHGGSSSTTAVRPASLERFVGGDGREDMAEKEDDNEPKMITTCMGGIQNNMDMDISVLGDIFLKAVFVVLDMRGRVGFADKEL